MRADRQRMDVSRYQVGKRSIDQTVAFQRRASREGARDDLDADGEAGLERLVAMEDHDLWDLVSGRRETDDPQLRSIVERLRQERAFQRLARLVRGMGVQEQRGRTALKVRALSAAAQRAGRVHGERA